MAYSVLIVDDEDLTLCTISRGLTADGFEVLTVASGEEALQIFGDEKNPISYCSTSCCPGWMA